MDDGDDILEIVQTLLPATIAFYANFHTTKDHFLTTTKIDAQLNDISILDLERFRLNIRLAKPDMVQEGSRRALYILDIPLRV